MSIRTSSTRNGNQSMPRSRSQADSAIDQLSLPVLHLNNRILIRSTHPP
ncbi:hypothetical protein [Kibdelosporangium philippinense]